MLAFNCEWKRQSRREYTALDHPSGYDPEIMLVSILSKTDYGIYLKSKNVWSFLINVHTFYTFKEQSWITDKFVGNVPGHDTRVD